MMGAALIAQPRSLRELHDGFVEVRSAATRLSRRILGGKCGRHHCGA